MSHLKKLFPDKQIILLTPLHRSLAEFGEKNVQPDESSQNKCGEYVDAYVQAIKEAGNLWGVPVIDFNSVTGCLLYTSDVYTRQVDECVLGL